MKTDSVFKRAFNDALDIVVGIGSGGALPSENDLSAQLGVSRTTVRKVLSALTQQRMVVRVAAANVPSRQRSRRSRNFRWPRPFLLPTRSKERFMEWMLRDNTRPGNHRSTNLIWRGASAWPRPSSASFSTASSISA